MKRAAAVAALALLAGCMEVDVFIPVECDAYELPGNAVPEGQLAETSFTASDGVRLAAIWALQPDPAAAPTALYLHGQAENLDGAWERIQVIWGAGYNVLAVDYRGFGRSAGTPSEGGVYRDAAAALAAARASEGLEELLGPGVAVDPDRIVIWGFSLGTGVASWLAAQEPVAALVLEAPYTSMWDLVEETSPYGVPGDWLTDAELDTLGRIARIGEPLVVAYGTDDRRVPSWMSRDVFERALGPKRLVRVEGASHVEVGPDGIGAIVGALDEMLAAP